MLLVAGRRILQEEGLGSGAEAVTFKRVFDRVEKETGTRLTNASVIQRVWENQADFQSDLLVTVALGQNDEEVDGAVKTARPTVTAFDVSTPDARSRALRELCRVAGHLNAQALRNSRSWPLLVGVWALTVSGEDSEHRKRIEVALRSGYETFTERVESVYSAMNSFLGFRLREPFTLRDFVIAADSLAQGFGLRDRIDDSMMKVIIRTTGPGGAEQEWTLFAVAFEGLVAQFFEMDPGWRREPPSPSRPQT
jgi:hypothetical protein